MNMTPLRGLLFGVRLNEGLGRTLATTNLGLNVVCLLHL
jgi:hypothetical protein